MRRTFQHLFERNILSRRINYVSSDAATTVIRRLKKQMILYSTIQTDKSTGVAYLVILLLLTRHINDSTVQEELELCRLGK
jgi:hypothetical protein